MYYNIPNEVTLRLLPVCECGYVISDLEIDIIVDTDGWKSKRCFSPDRCPHCGRLFECMAVDEKFLKPFVNKKE